MKKRIQINLSDEVIAILDSLASSIGVSRSSLCAIYILEGLKKDGYSFIEKKDS